MRALLILLAGAAVVEAAELEIRYLAHAAFQLTSPGGIRLVLDPYNSHVWLGYSFPQDISADAVLVTHPHFDHDAHYYVRGFPAVFRNPGRYAVGDVTINGVKGRHADPYGAEFARLNTIWVIEIAGVRLVHLGDNGPLSPATVRALGRVDILLLPADETEHILRFAEIEEILGAVRPRVVVPMHYRLGPGMGPEDLGGIDSWLKKFERVREVGNRARFSSRDLPAEQTVYRFQPAAEVRPWSAEFWEAIRTVRQFHRSVEQAKGRPGAEHLAEWKPKLARATTLEPGFIAGWHARAVAERLDGRVEEAIGLLQAGLAVAYPDDTERTTLARALLAELLAQTGRNAEAQIQWRELLRASHRLDLTEQARRGLGLTR